MYDIIVIGAGMAGLTAALYGARAGKTVLVLEENMIGGQIINSPEVENYPGIVHISGFQLIAELRRQAEDAGAEIVELGAERVEERDWHPAVITGEGVKEARTVILATGVVKRKLGLEREEELVGRGVSYCAVCDGAFYKGKTVAVIGGGNTALEDTLFLAEYCKRVWLIHRRDQFRGESRLVNLLMKKENVQFVLESTVVGLAGEERLEAIRVRNLRTNVIDELSVAALFVAVGQIPQNERFADLVPLDSHGYIRAGESCRTDAPGIFAAGDCRSKEIRQLVTAAADGAVAALAACAAADDATAAVASAST